MILYQALSSYQILECIIHRQEFYPDETCILLLGNYITERMPNYRELETRGFFDEVYLFRFGGYRGNEETILRDVEGEWRKTLPFAPGEFDKILAAGIHTYLQVYFLHENLPFEMFEDGSGALSRPHVLAKIHKKSSPDRYRLIEKYHLYDHSSPLITKKYCDMKAQVPGFEDEKAVDFNLLEYFQNLPQETRDSIRELFHVPGLECSRDAVLLLTQQFANLGQLSFEEQVLIYQNLFDYFLEGKQVLIKPHPDDILYYGLLFPEAQIIRELFPSELLPMAFEQLPDAIATISSTGVNLIQNEFKEKLFFNALYEKTFHFNHIYYMALAAVKAFGIRSIFAQGTNLEQLLNFARYVPEFAGQFEISEHMDLPDKEIVCILDDQTASELGTETLVRMAEQGTVQALIYLNTAKSYQMYRFGGREYFSRLHPLLIQKKRMTERNEPDLYDEERTDTIYIDSRKEHIIQMSRTLQREKELTHTKTKVSIEQMTDDQIRIRMLEGILDATERRLLEYVETEKELRKQLEEQTCSSKEA